MIVKTLPFADIYLPLSPLLKPAFEYLRSPDLANVPLGRHAIRGDEMYVLVESYDTQPPETKKWEAHRRYVDIQYVAQGVEHMGYAPRSASKESIPYDDARDIAFFEPSAAASFVTLTAGMFCILGPEDVHLPGTIAGSATRVRKIVLKLAASSFRS